METMNTIPPHWVKEEHRREQGRMMTLTALKSAIVLHLVMTATTATMGLGEKPRGVTVNAMSDTLDRGDIRPSRAELMEVDSTIARGPVASRWTTSWVRAQLSEGRETSRH
jgi:hypothetical protein